jgi:hypothetical protein
MIPDGVRLRGACFLVIHQHQNHRQVTFDVLAAISLLETNVTIKLIYLITYMLDSC